MAILCQPMGLTLQNAPPAPRVPPSASEKKRICRNLFASAPGDSEIDQLLAREQCSKRSYIKMRYGFDIQQEDQRDRDQDADADADTDTNDHVIAPRGMRYPTLAAIPSTDADECNPKAVNQAARGVALTAPEISASAQLILQKITHDKSDSSTDLANSTRHGQKPYATQPQGLKGIYRVRKANKGISKSKSQNSYSSSSSSNNNNNNNNVDNGASQLEDKEQ